MIITIVFAFLITGISFVIIVYPLIIKGARSIDEILLVSKITPEKEGRESNTDNLQIKLPANRTIDNEIEDEIERQVLALRGSNIVICQNCGNKCEIGAEVCINCGAELIEEK